MFNIDQFLNKIRLRQSGDNVVRMAVIETIKSFLGLDLLEKDIEIKPPRVFLKNIPQTARTEIFIKKTAILDLINKRHGGRPLKDIR